MVYRLDVYVGQIVQKLKDMGVYDNTIIIFSSDNGPHMEGGADPDFFNSNGIWRGYKRDVYEGGIRVPMIISWPGHVQPSTETDFMCSFWDLMPTFREVLNPKADTRNMDGVSILPLLQNRKGQKEHEYLYFGVKLGANYAKVRSNYNMFETRDNTWGFYVSPEIGLNVYPWAYGPGLHIAVYYSYATNKANVLTYNVDKLNNFGFRVGLAF